MTRDSDVVRSAALRGHRKPLKRLSHPAAPSRLDVRLTAAGKADQNIEEFFDRLFILAAIESASYFLLLDLSLPRRLAHRGDTSTYEYSADDIHIHPQTNPTKSHHFRSFRGSIPSLLHYSSRCARATIDRLCKLADRQLHSPPAIKF